MSILVKDYTWTQTANTIHIRVPINPVYREKIDLFSADTYIKAHYSPFLFEIFLLHAVNNSTSKCTIKDDLILFDLAKRDELDWECLEKDLTKAEKMKIKQDVLEQCQVQAKQASEDKRIRKSQLDRYTVQEAMAIDDKQHKLMDSRRDEQRKKAMEALEEWRVSNPENYTVKHVIEENNRFENTGIKIVDLSSSDDEGKNENNKKDVLKNDLKEEIEMKQQKIQVSEPIKTPVKSEYIDKKKQEASKRILPKLRETTELVITHTPRSFPTPSRESMANEEETWLKNITLARRATGFVSEDLRPEEQDPQWCKEKGDEFFRMGNFLGAISAYTHGITLSDKLPSLYANRAATHFALGNFNKCVNDSSTALDLMKPACEGNRRSRAKCIARRAAALTRLGYLNKAIDEMKAALKLLPDDDTIKKDIYNMERAWEQNPDSD